MKYTITNIVPQLDNSTGEQKEDPIYGKGYSVFVKDPEGQMYNFLKSWKKEAPKKDEVLEGTITQKTSSSGNTYYSFKEENNFQPGGRSSMSPEQQDQIMRQHAVTDAISYLSIKATTLTKTELAAKTLQDVLKTADLLLGYYRTGKHVDVPHVATETPRSAVEVLSDVEPLPQEEVDIDSIEF